MHSPLQTIYFMDTSGYAPGLFDTFFGGLFLVKGVPLAGQLLWMICLSVALAAAYGEHSLKRPNLGVVSRVAALLAFTITFFFLLQPWDEVFINLRHSLHLADDGVFSFNRLEAIEGTVDWLVYAVLGLLHRTGLPLEELAFIQGYLGALACVYLGQRWWCRWLPGCSATIPVLLLCFYPPLAFNSAHGFATTWFVALLFGAAQMLCGRESRVSIFALALVPLARMEGIFFFALIAMGSLHRNRSWRRLLALAAALLPFVALSIWRYTRFGSMIPLPIIYKATGMDLFYFAIGMRNLAADLLSCGTLVTAGVLFTTWRFAGLGFFSTEERKALGVAALFAVGCLPYYVSGGDWFPSYWGRYLLPFSLWSFLLVSAVGWRWIFETRSTEPFSRFGVPVLVGLLVVVHSLWPISSTWKFFEHFFAHRRTLAKIHPPTIGRGHYRIQHLSQLGLHLRQTTRPEDIIASSEVATIMYFARREALDLLGVANAEIARSPVREAPSLLRRFPQVSELPYLIFKRIRTDIVPKRRPEYLYTFDFMWRDLMPDVPFEELTEELFFKAIHRWESKLGGLMDVLYGGVGRLIEQGYQPVVVRYSNHFLSMYFVRSDQVQPHLKKLEELGFNRRVFKDASLR